MNEPARRESPNPVCEITADAIAVRTSDLSHSYGETKALDGISIEIATGEIICLLGHSGCGKTTFMRALAGIERPSSGDVYLDNEHVSGPGVFVPPERRGVGMMFQDFALFPHLSVAKNVSFGLQGLARDVAQLEATAALDLVGLSSEAEHYPHMLSGGMQQRVALARALAPKPRILLMDEPFSGLDRRTRDKVRDETLEILRDLGTTTIVVTHDPDEALRIADRIVLMRSGRVVQDGTAQDFYYAPADLFAARFFHELNEFDGSVSGGKAQTALGPVDADGLPEGTLVNVGVRQAAISVEAATHPNQVIGTVKTCKFLGEEDLLGIALEGSDRVIYARNSRIGLFKPGERVALSIHPDSALVFEKTG
ncbi:MAG: ABC transporter ATP-binding protein [Pseudomonadota bacterium]